MGFTIARGTLSGLLLLLLFCCWKSPRLTPRVTWRLKVQAAVIGPTCNEPALARGRQKTAGPITNNGAKVGRIKACVAIDT
jgi:hypothetical protein